MDADSIRVAIGRLEDEMGDWGSISMRLSNEALADIRTLIEFAKQAAGLVQE